MVKNLSVNAGDVRDVGSIPGSGRSPGGRHGNLLQYSCLENPMDREAWWGTSHAVSKSWTWLRWLRRHTCIIYFMGFFWGQNCWDKIVAKDEVYFKMIKGSKDDKRINLSRTINKLNIYTPNSRTPKFMKQTWHDGRKE